MKKKLVYLIGTRPDLARSATLIPRFDEEFEHTFVWSGQHFDLEMKGIFHDQLGIRMPDIDLQIGSGTHAQQNGRLIERAGEVFAKLKPDAVLVLGDANPCVAGFAAAKMHIPLAHIEGGMRSFDRRMPEEINRRAIDHVSDRIYVYLEDYRENILLEGIPQSQIKVVGNIIVDVVNKYLPLTNEGFLKSFGVEAKKYVLWEVHREENIDDSETFKCLLESVVKLRGYRKDLQVVWPMSFRVRKQVDALGLQLPGREEGVVITKPVGYLDFLSLARYANVIVTDSGTLSEEACILGVPSVVTRRSTERPQVMECGASVLLGKIDSTNLVAAVGTMSERNSSWVHPLGDGQTTERIVKDLVSWTHGEFDQVPWDHPWVDRRVLRSWNTPFGDKP